MIKEEDVYCRNCKNKMDHYWNYWECRKCGRRVEQKTLKHFV